jgi:hypothetical protein
MVKVKLSAINRLKRVSEENLVVSVILDAISKSIKKIKKCTKDSDVVDSWIYVDLPVELFRNLVSQGLLFSSEVEYQ